MSWRTIARPMPPPCFLVVKNGVKICAASASGTPAPLSDTSMRSRPPRDSVILDSVESGRVEEVFARDGAMVKKGQLLFRLSNPQRNLELLARQAGGAGLHLKRRS
jgi:multidrug efflux pump subunit AcrA (membrane-fusion protein)